MRLTSFEGIVETRIGNQRPTNCWVPEYADSSAARKSLKVLDHVGFSLDEWQSWSLEQILGQNDTRDGLKYASRDVCLLVPRQNGKGSRVDAPILTANRGWVKFGELNPGDEVFHPSGRATRVVFKSPTRLLDCYRVTTTDGRSEVFDGDHLWTVTDKCRARHRGPRGSRRRWFETVTLSMREMYETGTSRYRAGSRPTMLDGKRYRTNEYRYILPRQEALADLPKVDLPVDPYLIGAWLGDGSCAAGEITSSEAELDYWVTALSECWPNIRVRHNDNRAPTIRLPGLMTRLRPLGLYRNKHIPEPYLLAGDKQREALLQGLMDTDGTCGTNGRVEFCNTNKALAEDVLFLARSLGWRAVLAEGRATLYGKDCGPKYRVTWTPVQTDPYEAFRLPRKLARVKPVDGGSGRLTVSIKSIEKVDSVPTCCIKVESEDGLFLHGRDLIATHNTRVLEARALAGVLVLGEDVIFTAQNFSTCRESFYRVKAVLEMYAEESGDPTFREPSLKFRESNDNLAIVFRGRRIVYKARGTNPVRGFSPQVVIADEAYAMTDEIAAALQNSLRAQRSPQYICTSSTGLDDSDYLMRLRDRGLQERGEHALALMEWCATPGCDLDDIEEWYRSNPALGIRVDLETMENDRRSQADKQFGRECLGLWADNKFRAVVDLELWKALGEPPHQEITTKYVLAVDATPSAPHDASIALAGYTADGRKQVEVIDNRRGLDWVIEQVSALYRAAANPPPLAICVQAGAKAGSLIPELEKIRDRNGEAAEVIKFGMGDVTRACDFFYDCIEDKSLTHLGGSLILTALSGATKIRVGKQDGPKGEEEYRSFYWGRRDMTIDISPLCAATYALWGLNTKQTEAELNKKPWEGKPRGGRIW